MKRVLGLAFCGIVAAVVTACEAPVGPMPKSHAELTDYTETSRLQHVNAFFAEMAKASPLVRTGRMGTSGEGLAMPLVMISDPPVSTPTEAKALGRPIVFVMANIHAGEVEGKEAMQHLSRRLVGGDLRGLIKKMVVLIAPDYNTDGNEKIDLLQRTAQYGPIKGVGTRENSQGLDLNRDFIKMDAPETNSLVRLFNDWDPLVTVDLHTTNGSYTGYHLTYSIPLNPMTESTMYAYHREKLMQALTESMLKEHQYQTYYYGNFSAAQNPSAGSGGGGGRGRGGRGGATTAPATGPARGAATAPAGRGTATTTPSTWYAFTHAPRIGQNYVGLRNRFAILSEAYSYLHFRDRVLVTEAFVEEILQYTAAHAKEMQEMAANADRMAAARTGTFELGIAYQPKALPQPVEVLLGEVRREMNPLNNREMTVMVPERSRAVPVTDYGMFSATRFVTAPRAYVMKEDARSRVMVMKMMSHGVQVETLASPLDVEVQRFTPATVTLTPMPFQGHREVTVTGTYAAARETFPAGSFLIRTNQRLGTLAAYLLEPESDDGLTRWGFWEDSVAVGAVHPVAKVMGEVRK